MSYTVAEAQRAITELYVGIFNRAPDPEGLAYWTGKLVDEGADIDVVRAAFVDSVEWQNGVGQSTNAQVIQHLYESLFEREPEQEGFEFWLNELETGVTTVDQIVAVLIANASAYDQLTLDNKVDAALYYTTRSGGDDMVNDAGFNGAAATQAVDSVDYTTESLEASYAATDRSLEDAGSVFTLTEAEDEIIVGTQYDDIVRGSLGVTLSGFDTIDGGVGDDTLELTVATGDTLGIPGFVDVRNVETVTFDIVDGGLDAELVGGDNFEGLENVNVYSTGGTAESVRIEADVQNINIGMVRDEEGNLSERGVLEPDVYVYVVDNDEDDFDTNVAVSTDRGAYVESTGDLGDVDVTADGSSLSGDTYANEVNVLAAGDIASVTSTAGGDTYIESVDGNIGTVNATASFENTGSSIYVEATPSDPSSEAGNIESVTATADEGYVYVSALNDIGDVDARALYGLGVYSAQGDIDSVVTTQWTIDGDDFETNGVDVYAYDGAVGSVDVISRGSVYVSGDAGVGSVNAEITGSGNVDVDSDNGGVGSVTAEGASFVYVDASDNIDSVTATDIVLDVDVYSSYGDIGSVTVDGARDVEVIATDGAVGTVNVTVTRDLDVYASDDITSVTADAGDDVSVVSYYGNVGMVDADGSTVYVYADAGTVGVVDANAAEWVFVDGEEGVDSVDATAGTYVQVRADNGGVGSVDAAAGTNVSVIASDDIGSVDATAATSSVSVQSYTGGISNVDATAGTYVSVLAFDDIGTVNATADDFVRVTSVDGGVDSVTATGYYVGVFASDDIGMVDATAGEDGVRVESYYGDIDTVNATASGWGWDADVSVLAVRGDIGSVTADASDTVTVYAYDGAVDTVTATAGEYVGVYASDNIDSVTATAGYYGVDVFSNNGDIGNVDATAMGLYEADVTVGTGGNIGSVTADASDSVGVYAWAGGSVDSVDATAGHYIDVIASDDIGSVTAVTPDTVWVIADGDVESVDASSTTLFTFAGGSVENVNLDLSAGGEYVYANLGGNGAGYVNALIAGVESVGDVSVTSAEEGTIIDLVVASLGDVGSVSADAGSDSVMFIDVHAENDSSVDLTLTADSDASAIVFVGSVSSDAAMTSPTELNLTVADLDNDDATLYVDLQSGSSADAGSDEVTRLETINVDGGADAVFALDSLSETLTTFDGSEGTGDQTVYMTVPGEDGASEQSISITTGSGDDVVDVLYGSSDDNGSVTIATGAGNDYVTNDTDIQSATGTLTVTTGTGSDSVELYVGSDTVVDVTTGDDNDDVMIMADIDESELPRLGQGGDFAAAPTEDTWVDVDLTVDVGGGDDLVEIYANRDSIEAGSFAMGDGDNTLRYFYSPNGTVAWSDADTERFNLDNVSGSVHTLGIDVDLEISDDVTLDITGVGGVSVLEIGGADIIGTDAQGAVLTIDGAAADFTIVTNGDDDFGNAYSSGGDLDSDVLTLVTPGVESLTIDHGDSELGIYMSGSDNADLTSLTTIGGDDQVDVALAYFENGLEVNVSNTDGEAEVIIFGGTYGDVTITGSDDVDLSLQSYDYATSTDGQTPLLDRLDVTLGDVRLTNTEDDGQEVKFDIDGTVLNYYVTDGGGYFSGEDGAGTVSVGDVYLAGNFDTELEVDDFTDSAITVGNVSVTIATSDDSNESGYVDIDDLDYTTLTMGNIDVDVTVGSDSYGHDFDVQVESADHATITLGDVTLDQVYASSDTTDVYDNLFEVQVQYNEASAITLGDVTANLEGAAFDMDIENNTDSTIVIGDVDATGTAVTIDITDNVAETDDLNITIGNVTMHDNRADGSGMGLFIQDNTDDFSAGLTEISVGNVMMTGSDSAAIVVSGSRGETDDFSVRLVDRLGVQVDIGDVEIAIDASSGEDFMPSPFGGNSVFLSATDNDGADITVGNVDVSIAGSDGGLTAGTFYDVIDSNYETAYTRGDTSVSIGANAAGSSDAAIGYSLSYLTDNTDSEISLGDYSVTVGGSDTDLAVGFAVMFVDNNDNSLIEIGDVSMTVEAGAGYSSDAGVAALAITDNDFTEILVGDVTLEGASLAGMLVTDNYYMDLTVGDVDLGGNGGVAIVDNGDTTVTMGDVTQVGAGSDADFLPIGAPGTGSIYGLAVNDNDWTEVTIGNFSSSDTFASAVVEVEDNDDTTIEIGNVTLNDVSDVDIQLNDNTDDTLVTLGTVTINGIGQGDVDFAINSNTDDTAVTVGAVTMNNVSDVDIDIIDNQDGSFTDGTVTVGDILIDGVRDFDMDVFYNDTNAEVSLGDITVSDGTGSGSFYFLANDDSTIEVGDITLTTSSSDTDSGFTVSLDADENDDATLTIGSIDLDSGGSAGMDLDNNDRSTLGSDDSSINIDAVDRIRFDIDNNDDSTIMFSDVTLTSEDGQVWFEIDENGDSSVTLSDVTLTTMGGDVYAYIYAGDGQDGTVSLGDVTISASDDVSFTILGDAFGNDDDGLASMGDLSISTTGEGMDDDVDILALGATGLETISVSGGADEVRIQIGDVDSGSDTITQTTLIDLSGMTESDATVLIDFVDDSDKISDIFDEDTTDSQWGSANLSDDIVIKFGEFATAYVETTVNDNQDTGSVEDFDGVRQTYVFEGSDIGDITIEGFVAGFGAYRDVELNTTGYEDGRGDGDFGGGAGSNYFDYTTSEPDGQAQLRTDRLDFSQFEGVDSLDDLNFEFDDETDSVIITAADGQFDGRIIVTGQGVDADNGETDESIMDRVADSIIFG